MCNANGHHPGCICGFGGDGHLGSACAPTRPLESISYINPNARCPECHRPVYFYRSPDDGRVFFDSLYPDWLKHPCTDSKLANYRCSRSIGKPTRQSGWRPFYVQSIRRDGDRLALNGYFVRGGGSRFNDTLFTSELTPVRFDEFVAFFRNGSGLPFYVSKGLGPWIIDVNLSAAESSKVTANLGRPEVVKCFPVHSNF